MSDVRLRAAARSDVGLVREVNEDAALVRPNLFVVADGMGGHEGGDVASRLVVAEFARLAEEGIDPATAPEQVADALAAVQRSIASYVEERGLHGPRHTPGTTAVVATLARVGGAPAWLVANIGDSRAYRFGPGGLQQVSVDHSLVQELVDDGSITEEEAAHHPERHVITRALGGPGDVLADFFHLPLEEAPRLLLCTDGVNGMIDDEEIAGILAGAGDPEDAAELLVAAALAAGGRDNATAVVVDVVGLDPHHPGDAASGPGS